MFMRQVSIEIRKTVKHLALWIGPAVLLLLLALSALRWGWGILKSLNFCSPGFFMAQAGRNGYSQIYISAQVSC